MALFAGLMVSSWLIASADRGTTRVEVIARARPLVDDYFPLTLVARTESGGIDRGFAGDVWLWTDGPYLRPFHVEFRAKDQGVVRLPARLELPTLTRIEAYHPAGTFQTWSNPVWPRAGKGSGPARFAGALPVLEGDAGPGLYWGKLGDCTEPGLDFCLSEEAGAKQEKNGPLLLPMLTRQIAGETWAVAKEPDLQADEKNEPAASKNGRTVTLGRIGDGEVPIEELIVKGEPILIAPGRDCLLGVWADELAPKEIFQALREGRGYCSCGGRILIGLIAPASGERAPTLFVAGHGPREVVRIYRWKNGAFVKVVERSTDDFKLQVPLSEAAGFPGPYYLEVVEPGRRALAGPVFFNPAR